MRPVPFLTSLGFASLLSVVTVLAQSREYSPYQLQRTRTADSPQPIAAPIQQAEWEDSTPGSGEPGDGGVEQTSLEHISEWESPTSPRPGGLIDPSGESDGYHLRYTVRHDIGNGLGYEDSFTRLGVFLPLWEEGNQRLWFADLQPFVDNKGNFGANAGGGYRIYSSTLDRVFGAYAYFDYRETDYNRFRQGTVGFDSLGNNIDFRGNLYIPEDSAQRIDPRFAGHYLVTGFEEAMPGGDIEAGVVLPELFETQSRLLGGFYYFNTHEEKDARGWRVRIESHWTPEITTDVAFNQDSYFGSTVTVGLQWNMQPTKSGIGNNVLPNIRSFRRGDRRHITERARDRLAEPTHRQPVIAVRREDGIALNPANGNAPFNFLHVVPDAVGGNGTFESPFGSLEDALSTASPYDIVYTPSGGDFSPFPLVPVPAGQMLVIPDQVSLLSNGPVQTISTTQGFLTLPGSGKNIALDDLPSISNSVELGNGSQLNGFQLLGTANQLNKSGLILVDGKSDFTIANNNIDSLLDGIRITNGATNARILGNIINGSLESGIDISGTNFSGLIYGNTVTDNTDDGLGIVLTGTFDGTIASNDLSDRGSGPSQTRGLYLEADTVAAGSSISNNVVLNNSSEGMTIIVGDGPSEVDVFSNLFDSNNGSGREFFAQLNGTGAGLLTLNLGDNSSGNFVSATEFNFDLSKANAGDTFILTIPSPNNGTIGSSDGSYP